jgi:hypothetical protein
VKNVSQVEEIEEIEEMMKRKDFFWKSFLSSFKKFIEMTSILVPSLSFRQQVRKRHFGSYSLKFFIGFFFWFDFSFRYFF